MITNHPHDNPHHLEADNPPQFPHGNDPPRGDDPPLPAHGDDHLRHDPDAHNHPHNNGTDGPPHHLPHDYDDQEGATARLLTLGARLPPNERDNQVRIQ